MTEARVKMQISLVENALETTVRDSDQQTADLLGSVSNFFSGAAALRNGTLSPSVDILIKKNQEVVHVNTAGNVNVQNTLQSS